MAARVNSTCNCISCECHHIFFCLSHFLCCFSLSLLYSVPSSYFLCRYTFWVRKTEKTTQYNQSCEQEVSRVFYFLVYFLFFFVCLHEICAGSLGCCEGRLSLSLYLSLLHGIFLSNGIKNIYLSLKSTITFRTFSIKIYYFYFQFIENFC